MKPYDSATGHSSEYGMEDVPAAAFGLLPTRSAYAVALFLLSLTLSVMVLKFVGSTYISGVVVVAGLVALIYCTTSCSFLNEFLQQPHGIVMTLGLLLVMVSAGMAYEVSSVVKAFLLIIMMLFAGSRMPSLHRGELLCGFLIFSVLELVVVFATKDEWNPNAYCNHVSFACLCGAAGSFGLADQRLRIVGWGFLALCVGSLLLIGSRTASTAFIIPNVLYVLLLRGRLSVSIIRFFVFVFACLAVLLFGDITGGISRLALDNLDNDTAVARFFLYDKTESKIETDILDRRKLWETAFEVMVKNPVVGIGYDRPIPKIDGVRNYRNQRAHNSYLEIGYQCGILAMVVWGLFYFLMLDFSSGLIRDFGRDPIVYLAFTSTCYLVLAGMMESSGILSLAVPGNWIALSCFFFLAAGVRMMNCDLTYGWENTTGHNRL